MDRKSDNGAIANIRGATQNIKQFQADSALAIAQLLGTPTGLGTLRALEPRVLLDAAVTATLAEAAGVQSLDDAQVWALAANASANAAAPTPNPEPGPVSSTDPDLPVDNAESVPSGNEIVFIDSNVDDLQEILDSINPDAEIIILDAQTDGVEQMAGILANRQDIDAIHIISHGREGSLELGNTTLNQDSITGRHADELAIIRDSLSSLGDILIYGCDFGAGSSGQAAVEALALATGADVAASDDLTGAAVLGGDWDLEVISGSIESTSIEAEDYEGTLGPTTISAGNGSLSIVDNLGNPVASGGGVTTAGAVATWSNAGTVNGVAIDARATLTAIGPGDTLFFEDPSVIGTDDLSILLFSEGANFDAEVTIQWEIVLAGTAIPATGDIDFTIADIDGIGGVPNTRETVIPSLNGLTSYGAEAATNIQFAIAGGEVSASGTQNQNGELSSAATFSWTNVSSWEITYQVNANALTSAARFTHDGDGDFAFTNLQTVNLLSIDLDANNSTTAGFNYSGTFVEDSGGTPILDIDINIAQNGALGADLHGATVTLTNPQTGDQLLVAGSAAVSGTVNGFNYTIITAAGQIEVALTGTGTDAQYEAVLQQITFNNTSDTPSVIQRQLELSVVNTTFGTNSNVALSTIDITPVNDAPTASNDINSTDEDTAITISAATGVVLPNDTDPEADPLAIIEVNGVAGDVGNQITLGSGALLTLNTDGSYTYDPNGAFESLATGATATDSFDYTISDGNGGADTATMTLTINGVADAPSISLDPDNDNGTPANGSDDGPDDGNFEVTFIENGTPIAFVDSDVAITDPEDNIVEMVITLTNGQIGDTINFPSSLPGNITAAVAPASTLVSAGVMTITFTGDASTTNANWTTVLQALTFNPSTNDIHNPNPADRDINIQLSDAAFGFSSVVTATIHVVPENDPPTLDLDDDNSTGINGGHYLGTYIENAAGLPISDGVAITDLDDVNLESLTIVLTNGEIGDVLEIGALPAGISLVGSTPANLTSAGAITVTLTGSATLADYQTAIAAITFSSDSENPASGTRNITVTGNDGDDNTPTRTAFITVTPVNDPPVPVDPLTPGVPPVDPNAVIPDQSGQDADALTPLATAQYFADPDDTALTFSLDPGAPAWVSINATTGEITGTPPSDASQNTNNGTAGSYDVIVIATDPGTLSGQTTVVFNITNPAPVAQDDTLAATEDDANLTGSVFDPNGTPSGDSDPDGDTITVSEVDGAPAGVGNPVAASNGGLFTINSDGTYIFDQNGGFNDLAAGQTRITTITYQISDGQGGTDTATISLTVTGTNDAPTATDDTGSTNEDTVISITAVAGLITPNDTDPDTNDTLVVSQINGVPANVGSQFALTSGALLTVNADGSYDYDPNGAFENLAAGETGTDSFTYEISDGNGGTDTATVNFTITGVNDAPVAVNDTGSTDEDTIITTTAALGLINPNDTDPDATDVLTVMLVNGLAGNVGAPVVLPSGATLTVNSDGSYVYDPTTAFDNLAAGETGTDSFTYTVDDGNGGTSQATVNLTITGVNDAPVAVNDTGSTDEDTIITTTAALGLINPNDTDPDATDVLTVMLVNGLAGNVGAPIVLLSGATLTVNSDGSYVYDPTTAFDNLAAGETGTDSFTYTVDDGNGGTSQATVNLTITGVNDAPVAVNDTGSTDEDTIITTTAALGLIDPNDTDPDATDTLVISQVNGVPANIGTQITLASGALLTVNADGSYDYDPNGAFESLAVGQTGNDSFTYTISDGNGGTGQATVNFIITGVNDVPVVIDPLNPGTPPLDPDNIIPDVAYTDGETTATIDISTYIVDPDGDPLIFSATGLPPGLSINATTGEITGSLDPDASNGGADPVASPGVYHVIITGLDIHGANISTTVDYTITNVDPVAVDDTGTTNEDSTATGNVITGPGADIDGAPDSDPLVVSQVNGIIANVGQPVTGSSGGTFIINPDGSWTFDPGNDFAGLALGDTRDTTMLYQVSDGNGGFDTATLTVTVDGANDAPLVGGPLAALSANDGETITPLDTTTAFSNPGSIPLTYGATGLPAGLTIDPVTGIVSGTIDNSASLTGIFPVTITAMQTGGQIIETTLVITISNVAPDAIDDGVSTPVNTPVTINALANDTDGTPDSDPLTVSQITSPPSNGTVAINPDGTLTYTPAGVFTGTDTFTYEVSDGEGGTDTATITIAVGTPAPDTPVATPIAPANLSDGETITPIDVTGSFTDPNADVLTYNALNLPSGLTIDTNSGQITGVVDNNASQAGPYTVIITASDPDGNQVSGQLIINVTNPVPVAVNDSADTAINTPVTIVPLANDSDPDGDPLSVALINNQPSNGTVVINPDGTVTYTPNGGFTGTDTFSYILEDANGGRDEAVISLNVGITGPDTPLATPLAPAVVDEGSPITPIDVTGSFTDPNGDPLTYSASGLPDGLNIDINTGLITGTPVNDASASGPFSVQVTAVDPDGNQVTQILVINVNNPAPTGVADDATTAIDTPVTINVLANDTDPDDDLLTVSTTTPPANGTIVVNANGTITYTPDPGFSGTDTFTYTVSDAQGATSPATVTLDVSAAPSIPQPLSAIPAVSSNDGATPATLDVSTVIIDPDGDVLIWSAAGLPAGLSINAANGQITGTINASASQGGPSSDGVYTATITAEDTSGDTVTTTIAYTITNLAPDARDDAVTHAEDGTATGDVFADNGSGIDADTPPDSDPVSVSQVNGLPANVGVATTSVTGGQFTINANGTYTFDPGTDFQDLDTGESRDTSITYQISDGQGGFDTATITVTVTGANDAPVVTDPGNPSGNPNVPSVPADPDNIIPDITGNDGEQIIPLDVSPYFVDVDGEQLTFTIDPAGPSAPAWLQIDPVTGIITGTPPANASQGGPGSDGVYSIVLIATDPEGETVTTTLDFTILNVPPVIVTPLPDVTDTAGYTVSHPSVGSFNDPDGDVLSFSATGLPPGLSIDPQTGEFSGTIASSAVSGAPLGDGVYTVTITVDDGEGGMASSTFTYKILPLPFVDPGTPSSPSTPLATGGPFDSGTANNSILTTALDQIAPLGPHQGIFDAKYPVTEAINLINPLGPLVRLGDGNYPISDLVNWIEQTRAILAGAGEGKYLYLGGDAVSNIEGDQIHARSLVIGQRVMIEVFGSGFDPADWKIKAIGNQSLPGWLQDVDGRTILVLRPADLDNTGLILQGPSGDLELLIDLIGGELEFSEVPEQITLAPVFSEQLEQLQNTGLKQVRSLFGSG